MCNNGRSDVATTNSDGSGTANNINCCKLSTYDASDKPYTTFAECNAANTGGTGANAEWCPLSDNYDVDGTWGYCVDSPVTPSGAYLSDIFKLSLFSALCCGTCKIYS